MDAVTILVSRSGHYNPTYHRFSSPVFVSAPPLLRRLALRVTQKHLHHLDELVNWCRVSFFPETPAFVNVSAAPDY